MRRLRQQRCGDAFRQAHVRFEQSDAGSQITQFALQRIRVHFRHGDLLRVWAGALSRGHRLPYAALLPSHGGNSLTNTRKIANGRIISAIAGSSPSRVANSIL